MGLTSAIYTSMSALDSAGSGIANVGNNMANINTPGFKDGRVLFSDVLMSSVQGETSPDEIGSGVTVQAVQTDFRDGTMMPTNNPLDFAISGSGFFMVHDPHKTGSTFYTRAGSFSLDKTGSIVDPDGNILQGYLADASGNISKNLTGLTLPFDAQGNLTTPAKATANAALSVQLCATDQPPAAFTFNQSNNTIQFTDGTVPNGPVPNGPAAITYTATIKPGTYPTFASLAAAVQSALNNAGSADTFTVDANPDATITITNTTPITITTPPAVPASVTMFTGGTANPQQIGFPAGTTTIAGGGGAAVSSDLGPVNWANNFTKESGPASGSSNYSSTVQVLDSAGNRHDVNIDFVKSSPFNWNAFAVWDAAKPDANGNISHNYQYQHISGLNFSATTDSTGQTVTTLTNPPGPVSFSLSWDPAWNAAAQTVSMDFSKSTQYGSSDSVMFQSADGYASGGLKSFNLKQDGTLDGVYDNGQEIAVAQAVLAKFNAPTQLVKQGNNLYAASDNSGNAILLTPGTGGAGSISGSALESSNVDEAGQFVTMISMQRAFGMNSTVMKSVDEMYTNLISVKS